MRQFKIYNQAGSSKDITRADAIFTDPAGLGVTLSPNFADLRQGFFKLTNDSIIPQGNIVGTLVFRPKANATAYEAYKSLADWLLKATELYFGYKPDATSPEYRCRVMLDYLTKTEIKNGLCVEAPVSFKMLTPWYLTTPVTPQISSTTSSGARIFKATITGAGQIPAAFQIVITGTSSTKIPSVISLRDYSTQAEVDAVGFYINRPTANRFEFSTLYDNSFVRDGAGNDLVRYISSARKEPFFHIPADRNYDLWIMYNAGDVTPTAASSVSVSIYNYFRTI